MSIKSIISKKLREKYGNHTKMAELENELHKERTEAENLWHILHSYFEQKNGTYFSQYYQDLFVDIFFKEKANGVFVDIGAWDGITFSNSYFLEKRGWNGILIEPNPLQAEALSKNRSGIIENICVSDSDGKVEFLAIEGYASMLSGIKSSFSDDHLQRIDREISQFGGSKREVMLDCLMLKTVFAKHKIEKIDYLSIDTEGHEIQVLNGIDFTKTSIELIGLELDFSREKVVENVLKAKGYERIFRIETDVFFKKAV